MTLKKPFWRRFWLALVAVIAGPDLSRLSALFAQQRLAYGLSH